MNQKALTVVIDAWTAAIERLAEHAPPDVIAQLHQATGDLIEAFGSAAQSQASQFAMLMRKNVDALERDVAALDARTDRRHEDVEVGEERRIGE
jgi:hypothetical protein